MLHANHRSVDGKVGVEAAFVLNLVDGHDTGPLGIGEERREQMLLLQRRKVARRLLVRGDDLATEIFNRRKETGLGAQRSCSPPAP